MNISFSVNKQDTPKLSYTIRDAAGPVDLTGGAVQFVFQGNGVSFTRTAQVAAAAQGKAEYQMTAEDTAVPGIYQAQWVFTKDSAKRTFPEPSINNGAISGEYIVFEIVDTIPISTPIGFTRLADCTEMVRAILDDHKRRRYEEQAILSVLRTVIRMGQMPGYTISADNRFISPAINNPLHLARLVLRASQMIVMPNAAAYSYKLRSMSESFGEQRHLISKLEEWLHEAEGGRVLHSFQTFYDWVGATAGVNIAEVLTDLRTRGPVGTVTIGSDGVHVS